MPTRLRAPGPATPHLRPRRRDADAWSSSQPCGSCSDPVLVHRLRCHSRERCSTSFGWSSPEHGADILGFLAVGDRSRRESGSVRAGRRFGRDRFACTRHIVDVRSRAEWPVRVEYQPCFLKRPRNFVEVREEGPDAMRPDRRARSRSAAHVRRTDAEAASTGEPFRAPASEPGRARNSVEKSCAEGRSRSSRAARRSARRVRRHGRGKARSRLHFDEMNASRRLSVSSWTTARSVRLDRPSRPSAAGPP